VTIVNQKHLVYLGKVEDNLGVTLRDALEYIRWERHINKKTRVFVKPNFTFPRYTEGITTNPELLRHLLKFLRDKAGTVIVGESDGGNHSFTADEAFAGHGMYDICQETGAQLVNLSTLPATDVEATVLGKKIKVQLPKMLLEEVDCFISVPVLKVHVMTTVTLSLKNSWGCVPDTMRGMHHQDLPYKLALIAKMVKPRIVVIDGTYALNNHGPMYGDPVKMDLVIASDNTVAADALGTRIMGFNPRKIPQLKIAGAVGLGSAELSDMEVSQDWQPYQRQFYIEKTIIDRLSSILFNSDTMAKLVFDSPLTPPIYKVVGFLRSASEKELASQLSRKNKIGPY